MLEDPLWNVSLQGDVVSIAQANHFRNRTQSALGIYQPRVWRVSDERTVVEDHASPGDECRMRQKRECPPIPRSDAFMRHIVSAHAHTVFHTLNVDLRIRRGDKVDGNVISRVVRPDLTSTLLGCDMTVSKLKLSRRRRQVSRSKSAMDCACAVRCGSGRSRVRAMSSGLISIPRSIPASRTYLIRVLFPEPLGPATTRRNGRSVNRRPCHGFALQFLPALVAKLRRPLSPKSRCRSDATGPMQISLVLLQKCRQCRLRSGRPSAHLARPRVRPWPPLPPTLLPKDQPPAWPFWCPCPKANLIAPTGKSTVNSIERRHSRH